MPAGLTLRLNKAARASRSLGTRPTRPCGRNNVTTTNSAPSTYSQAEGIVLVSQLLPPATMQAPMMAPISDAAPAHRHPDRHLDRVRRLHLAGVDDPDLRHVERARQPAQHRGQRPDEQLVVGRLVAAEARLELGVADGGQHAAEAAGHHVAAEHVGREQRDRRRHVQRRRASPDREAARPGCA